MAKRTYTLKYDGRLMYYGTKKKYRFAGLCEESLHELFDFPQKTKVIDIIVSDKPFKKAIEFRTTSEIWGNITDENGTEHTLLADTFNEIRHFGNKPFYVDLKY